MHERAGFGHNVGVVLGCFLVFSLAACAPTSVEPPTPTPLVTVSPTPTADPAVAPDTVFDIGCPDLAGSASITTTFGTQLAPSDAAAQELQRKPTLPLSFSVLSLGGLTCQWDNGEAFLDESRLPRAEYTGLEIWILPNALTQWQKAVDHGLSDYCNSIYAPRVDCYRNFLVGSNWVQFYAIGAVNEDAVTALQAEITATVTASTSTGQLWAVPEGTLPLGATCPELVSDGTVQAAMGISEPIEYRAPSGEDWDMGWAALETWGGPQCLWGLPSNVLTVGALLSLPGGQWAWEQSVALDAASAAPEAVSLPGLTDGDEAWLRCASDDTYCLVDLVIGKNWLQVRVFAHDLQEPVDHRASALAISQAIVTTLRG